MTITVSATDDLDRAIPESIVSGIGLEYCSPKIGRRSLNSEVEVAPSFIELLGSLASWKTIATASATVFFSTLAKRFADDLYDHKKIVAESLLFPFRKLARVLLQAVHKTEGRTHLHVVFLAPKGVPNPVLSLSQASDEEAAFELACFYAVASEVIERLSAVAEEYQGRVTKPFASVDELGRVTVVCYGGLNNDRIEFVIPIREER